MEKKFPTDPFVFANPSDWRGVVRGQVVGEMFGELLTLGGRAFDLAEKGQILSERESNRLKELQELFKNNGVDYATQIGLVISKREQKGKN